MKAYRPVLSFDEEAAKLHDERGDEAEAVDFLEELAGTGPVLELGVGTGRLALPLAARGLRVDGIDISPAMVERLHGKPGGEQLQVEIGDFADVAVSDRYALIFVAWNSFFNLLTQDDQVRCFENVAAHLTDAGLFAIEAYTPAFLYRLRDNQEVSTEAIEVDEVRIGVLRHDPATQSLEQSHVAITSSGIRLNPVVQRYAWPSELDLMARIAGLRLKQRWGSWNKEPFSSGSATHISVYGR